jgi:twitching motility two-component system response regulator PilH
MANILIVDDSPTQVAILSKILEPEGHQIKVATNGEEGIAAARADQPDLILMDVVMPGLNGFQATRKLTRDPATQDIPVILVSTKDQETDRIWGLRQGARGYLVKPPESAELIGMVNDLLG